MSVILQETQDQLLAAFQRAATDVPAYRQILDEHGVHAEEITGLESFSGRCPLLARTSTFDRFPMDQLCAGGSLGDLADVLTSSGHGGQGRFSYGLINRKQAAMNRDFIDQAFDDAFQVKLRKTLAINCLPMGVGFSSNVMTVATTSVREDMAVALVQTFGHHYEQILLVGDPLFMKRLTDFAVEKKVDWGRYCVNVLMGEEIFGEHFRSYIAKRLGVGAVSRIMASLGVAELGLHLGYETPATIALRRAALENHNFAQDLLGVDPGQKVLPMLYSFNPKRIFVEVIGRDSAGYGQMAISTMDTEQPVPLLRYQTGDIIRLLEPAEVDEQARRHGFEFNNLPEAMFALQGREKERLPNGAHVGFYKDALYADHKLAGHLTGAFRLILSKEAFTMHIQLLASAVPNESLEQDVLRAIPPSLRPDRVVLWQYDRFPFGMVLDYERKFTYYKHGESELSGV